MEYLIGVILGLMTFAHAKVVGFDRDRAFYPTILIIIASYYVLFAAMGGSTGTIIIEAILMMFFAALAIAGFKRSMLLVAVGLVAHGLFDFIHSSVVTNPGVSEWWPGFCLAYDLVLAALIASTITRQEQGSTLPDGSKSPR
jgi:hypothetical protein